MPALLLAAPRFARVQGGVLAAASPGHAHVRRFRRD